MATVNLFLDTRRNNDGFGLIKINVTHNRVQRLYTTGIKIDRQNFEKFTNSIGPSGLSGKVKNEAFIDLYNRLFGSYLEGEIVQIGFVRKANEIIETLGKDFSFEGFKQILDGGLKVKKDEKTINCILANFDKTIEQLFKEDRIGSALAYKCAKNSILKFLESQSLDILNSFSIIRKNKQISEVKFESVNVGFLKQYEKWMLKEGKEPKKMDGIRTPATISTVSINLRQLRAIFNKAISDNITSNYPFGKGRYQIPASKNTKKSISKDDIKKLLDYTANPETMEQRSHDIWVFSYLSNGMNITDICNLKRSDFNTIENCIEFSRQKTINSTRGNQTKIKVYFDETQLEIIERWKSKSGPYLFDFISEGKSALETKNKIRQIIKVTNFHMRKIGRSLGIEGDLNTYTARHTFATILLRSQAPLAFISKSLGHSNFKTTEAYLGSFEEDKVREYLKVLK